jgi:hypothetical protein
MAAGKGARKGKANASRSLMKDQANVILDPMTGKLAAVSLLFLRLSAQFILARVIYLLLVVNPAFAETFPTLPAFFEPVSNSSSDSPVFAMRHANYSATVSREALDIYTHSGDHVRLKWKSPSTSPLVGEAALRGRSNYFVGANRLKWRTSVPHFAKVRAPSMFPGIDGVFRTSDGLLEYDFIVDPGGDVEQIRLEITGAVELKLDDQQNLLVRTARGELIHKRPVAYQMQGHDRVEINCQYQIFDGNAIGFQIANFDRTAQLIIDPILSFSTYLGHAGAETGRAIAVDQTGHVYVTGETSSVAFPLVNPVQSVHRGTGPGSLDAYVIKMHVPTRTIVYATYLGSSGSDIGYGIAVDSVGNAYVTGAANGPDFPLQNSFQTASLNGDAFVTKLNAAGGLVYSTLLGGAGGESGKAIALDGLNSAYIAGLTTSSDFPLHTPFRSTSAGRLDIFVTKLSPSGTSLVFSTYLGGMEDEDVGRIVLDSAGNVLLTGSTQSRDFPVLNQVQSAGTTGPSVPSAFVTKLNSSGSALIYSTFLGPAASFSDPYNSTYGKGITVDSSGTAYVTGATSSPGFPLVNPIQLTYGFANCFVAKLDPLGRLTYATLIGNRATFCSAIALDSGGHIWVGGQASFRDFPLLEPVSTGLSNWNTNVILKLRNDGSAILFSTFLGTPLGQINFFDMAIDSADNVYVTGEVAADGFPTVNPIQPYSQSSDIFLSVIGGPSRCSYVVAPMEPTTIPAGGGEAYVNVTTQSGCFWNAISHTAVELIGPHVDAVGAPITVFFEHSGSGQVRYRVPSATTGTDQAYNILVAGHRVVVRQQGYGCAPKLPVVSGSLPASGGTSYFAVVDRGGCSYEARTSTPWLSLVGSTSGTGGGNVTFSASANATGVVRVGTILVGALTYTVTQPPISFTVVPSAGAGASVNLTGTFTAGAGVNTLEWAQFLIATAPDGGGEPYCLIHYDVRGNSFWFFGNGGFFIGPVAPGSASLQLQNSHCLLKTSLSSVSGSGSTISINAHLIFKAVASRKVYLRSRSFASGDSGWTQVGTWTQLPAMSSVSSVVPSDGGVSAQSFALSYLEPPELQGEAGGWVQFLIAATADGSGQPFCFVHYDRAGNGLWMYSIDVGFFLGPVIPGTTSSALNSSACSVDTAATSISIIRASTTLVDYFTLTIPVTMKSRMSGRKTLFQRSFDALQRDSGWVQTGGWSIP